MNYCPVTHRAIVNARFFNIQTYVVMTGHERDVYKLRFSEKTWQKLSTDGQQALESAAKEAAAFGDSLLAEAEAAYIEILRDSGAEVIDVDPADSAAALSDRKQ